MITKRTRILSLLSTIVMLVGMLSCFTLPASAAATEKDAWYNVILSTDWEANTRYKSIKTAYVGGDYETVKELLIEGFDDKSLHWLAFDGVDVAYPRYVYNAEFKAVGYDGLNWSITDPSDWEAMREVADSINATLGSQGADAKVNEETGEYQDYFDGITFHLTNNIEFKYAVMKPMGFSIYEAGGGFAGTIDGHGYGFNDIYISVLKADQFVNGDTKGTAYKNASLHAGLFQRLANCTIRNFGINGGLIAINTGNGSTYVSGFGNVISGKTPNFEYVWSSVNLYPYSGSRGSALVGSYDSKAITVDVNGFVFDGSIVKSNNAGHGSQLTYAVYSGGDKFRADGNDFYNIITDYESLNGTAKVSKGNYVYSAPTDGYDRGVKSALFNFSSVAAFRESKIENVFAVKRESDGIDEGYFLGKNASYGGSGSDGLLTDMSAAETAYYINNHPSQNAERVYFKMNAEGKIRPSAKGTNRVVKVTMTGDRNEVFYIGREVIYDQSVLGITDQQTIDVKEGTFKIANGSIKVSGDVVLEVTVDCTHDYSCVSTGTGNTHTKTCAAGCTAAVEESCAANSYTANAITADQLVAGEKATHSGICKDCGVTFTQECTFEYEVKKGESNVWNFDCACGREDLVHTGVSLMVAGNANGNATIDLIDAVAVLKNLVSGTAVNELNADMNGNNRIDVTDAYRIILLWMGDTKVLLESEDLQARVNTLNHYDSQATTNKNLKMDGTWGENDRYYVTDLIEVGVGNKVTFGPVRYAQPVMGFFYDAQDKPMQLINQTNIETVYTFEEGMIMASVIVPSGAESVRLQVNAKEKDIFYTRINNKFSVMDYEYQAKADSSALDNPLKDQLVLNIGDSLCAAGSVVERDPYPAGLLGGWSRRIYQQYGAAVINSSEGGSALSTIKYTSNITGEDLSSRQCIVNQLNEHTDIGREFEYILLEGGGNDAANGAEVGWEYFNKDSYNPKDFAPENTYVGGLERAIYTAIKEHGDTAAIGYMSVYNMPYAKNAGIKNSGDYFKYAQQICDKWGIPYLDLYTILTTEKFDASVYDETSNPSGLTYDGIHANNAGYDVMYEYIGPFMEELEPIDQEIYLKVQQYDPIDKVLGWED